MSNTIDAGIFRELYEGWTDAISNKKFDWFERHLSSDFSATAHVWPNLRLDKEQFIELDKQIVELVADWQTVDVVEVGGVVVTVSTLRIHREVFKSDTAVEGSDDSQDDLANLASGSVVTGKLVTYTGTWLQQGGVWQIKDHRMVHAID